MKLTNLSQVREALELAEQNSNQTFKIIMCCDQLKNALVAIGERYGIAGHCATLTALGRDLLAALRDAARVPELERERDEARAAVDTLTRALRLSVALSLPEGRDVDVAVAELLGFARQMKEPAQ
jgi:hypothetical protein